MKSEMSKFACEDRVKKWKFNSIYEESGRCVATERAEIK